MLKHSPVLKKLADKYGINSQEFNQAILKYLYNCPICGKKLIPEKKRGWDGHSFKFPCKCLTKNFRICSG